MRVMVRLTCGGSVYGSAWDGSGIFPRVWCLPHKDHIGTVRVWWAIMR